MYIDVDTAVTSLLSAASKDAAEAILYSLPHDYLSDVALAIKDRVVAAGFSDHVQRDRAVAVLRDMLSITYLPEIEGTLWWVEGVSLVVEGEMQRAIDSLDAAEVVFIALNRPLIAAETQVSKIVALANLGQIAEAESCSKRILSIFTLGEASVQAVKVELNLGSMMLQQDRYAEAEQFYRSAGAKAARAGDMIRSVRADCGLASALTWLHRFDEARLIHERVIVRATRHDSMELVGIAQSGLARLELFSGNVGRALRLSESWLKTAESLGSHVRLFDAQRDIADVYFELNLLPEAHDALQRLEDLATRTARTGELPWIQVQYGRVLVREGDLLLAREKLDTARHHYARLNNTFGLAYATLNSAEIALANRDCEVALTQARDAAAAFAAVRLTSFHAQALNVIGNALVASEQTEAARAVFVEMYALAEDIANDHIRARALTGIGQCELLKGNAQTARSQFEFATEAIERRATSLPSTALQSAVRAEFQAPYDGLLYCEFESAVSDTAENGIRFLTLMERARWLADYTRSNPIASSNFGSEGSTEDGQILELRNRLKWIHHRTHLALSQNASASELYAEAIEAERDFSALLRRRESTLNPSTSEAFTFDAILVQKSIPGDTLVLQFHCLADEIVLVAFSFSFAKVFRLPKTALELSLEKALFQMQSPRAASFAGNDHSSQWLKRVSVRLRSLFEELFQPVESLIDDFARVVFVPHGALHKVPWSALIDRRGRALVETHEIVIAGSTSSLATFCHEPRRMRSVLIVTAGRATLPHVGAESNAVSSAFDVVTQLDAHNATLSKVKQCAPSHDALHFACHGSFRADNPSFSSLFLDDGALAVFDAETIRTDAKLVTLSACESAVSDVKPGEDLTSLANGFLRAGARSVIASGWAVNDESTSKLMSGLYKRVCAGVPAGRALMLAQRELKNEFPHPYYWAGFSLLGQW